MAVPTHPGMDVNPGAARDVAAARSTIVVEPSPHAPVMLPSGRFASDAEYLQQGDDLRLIGPDGTTVIIRDYYLAEPRPDLMTPEGGRVTPAIVDSFTPPEAVGQYAQVGDSAAAPIGQVSSAVGQVFVVRTNGVREAVGAGDPIYQGDVVETAEGGAVDILFVDKTTFALGDDARLAIDKLVYNPDTHEGSSSYSILKGMFVFSSGEIAKINPLDMTVKTTVATIGIRGTKVAGEVNPAGEESKFTIIEGEIVVVTDAGYVVLSEANETTFVTGFNAPPSDAILFSDKEIDGFYGNLKSISNNYYGGNGNHGSDHGQSDEGGSQGAAGGEGEGDAPNLDKLAETFSDIAPAAGLGGDGEGEGEGTGGFVTSEGFETGEIGEGFQPDEFGVGDLPGGNPSAGSTGDNNNDQNFQAATTGGIDVVNSIVGGDGDETLLGTTGNDFIDGGAGNDIIDGGPGNDTLLGGAGNDTITGGDGNDVVDAGDGDDVIVAGTGAGNDDYDGGTGNDTIVFSSSDAPVTIDLAAGTASGAETDADIIANVENVVGGNGDDSITGNDSANTIFGGAGNDGIAAGAGNDVVDGGDGDDFITGGVGDDTITGGAGADGIFGDDGNDTVDGGTGADGIDGGDGDDLLSGGADDDNIAGGAGADILNGDDGADTLDGGAGDDLLRGGADNDVYLVSLGAGSDRIEDTGGDNDRIIVTGVGPSLGEFGGTSRDGDDLIIRLDGTEVTVADHFGDGTVETITFDFGDGTNQTFILATGMIGGDADGVIMGTDRGDSLNGGGGNDVLVGKGGNDWLVGGDGDDVFLVSGSDDGFDRITGGDGFDRIEGSAGDDVIGLFQHSGEQTVEAISGGGGFDVIRGLASSTTFDFSDTILIDIARIEGGEGNDKITGSSDADTIVGGAGQDNLVGGGGDDVFLVSGSGDGFDRFTGGDGFDRIEGSAGDDVIGLIHYAGDETVEAISGNGGFDVIRGGGASTTFDFSGTVLTGIAQIEGGEGNDKITGSSDADTIVGGAGQDNLVGGGGDDVFLVSGSGDGFDRFTGGDGFDRIEGSAGDDVIGLIHYAGEETVEAISGNGGFDVIRGGGASTTFDFSGTVLTGIAQIEGGEGNDMITGSAAADTILGGAGQDNLVGGGGDDVLIAGSGADRLEGGNGDDRLVIENDSFALLDGGDGTDTVVIDFALDLRNVSDSRLRGIESFDLGNGAEASLTIGIDDVLAATDGVNALTGTEDTLVVRRGGDAEVNVVGADWETSADSIDTDGDGVTEGYTVFHDASSGATIYVENQQGLA